MITTASYNANQSPVLEWDDPGIIRLLQERDEDIFGQLFKCYFRRLRLYATTIVQDQELAEDIVQTIFHRLWERIEVLHFSDSIAAYLYRAVYHESLNSLKHNKVQRMYNNYFHRHMKDQADHAFKKVQLAELEKRLRIAINDLPEQCRTIFQLSRFEELRYREIAQRLGISAKTVENQMGKALRVLRTRLVDLLPILVFYLSVSFLIRYLSNL